MPQRKRKQPWAHTLFTLTAAGLLFVAAGRNVQAATPTGAAKAPGQSDGVVDYLVDTVASNLYVLVRKDPDTVLSSMSHDHVIRATGWVGQVKFDPKQPQKCVVAVTLMVDKLVVDEDHMRKLTGLEGVLDAGDRADVEEHMRDEDQLHAKAHPTMSFAGSGCQRNPADPSAMSMRSLLQIRGQTKELQVPVTYLVEPASGVLRARGRFDIKATDFGFEPYRALFGALKNKNTMTIGFDVLARRVPGTGGKPSATTP